MDFLSHGWLLSMELSLNPGVCQFIIKIKYIQWSEIENSEVAWRETQKKHLENSLGKESVPAIEWASTHAQFLKAKIITSMYGRSWENLIRLTILGRKWFRRHLGEANWRTNRRIGHLYLIQVCNRICIPWSFLWIMALHLRTTCGYWPRGRMKSVCQASGNKYIEKKRFSIFSLTLTWPIYIASTCLPLVLLSWTPLLCFMFFCLHFLIWSLLHGSLLLHQITQGQFISWFMNSFKHSHD